MPDYRFTLFLRARDRRWRVNASPRPKAGALAGRGRLDASKRTPDPGERACALLQPEDSRRVAGLLRSALSDMRDDCQSMTNRIAVAIKAAALRSTAP
jgi:hypothetical protein